MGSRFLFFQNVSTDGDVPSPADGVGQPAPEGSADTAA